MNTLRTERLELVPVTTRNVAVLWGLLQQPDLREYQDLPNVSEAQLRLMIEQRPRELRAGAVGRFEWLIVPSDRRQAVGWASLRMSDRDPRTAEIGYSIISSERHRGIATEAVRAIANEGFSRAQLERIRAYCVPENAPSRALLERVGFCQDGILPRGASVRGKTVDVLVFVLERTIL